MVVFWIIWITWILSEILLNRFLRSGSGDKKNQDKGSLGFMWIMIVLGISASIFIAFKTRFPIGSGLFIPYIGLLLVVAGMTLRFISVFTLGKMFTVDVTIRENHQIKTDGVYRYIRHPSYTGSLLSFTGLGLNWNNWLSLITLFVLITISFIYRIRVEEKLLTGQFGSKYLDYMKKTYRLLPWIY